MSIRAAWRLGADLALMKRNELCMALKSYYFHITGTAGNITDYFGIQGVALIEASSSSGAQ